MVIVRSLHAARNYANLEKKGITHVLNAATKVRFFDNKACYIGVPLVAAVGLCRVLCCVAVSCGFVFPDRVCVPSPSLRPRHFVPCLHATSVMANVPFSFPVCGRGYVRLVVKARACI